MEFTTLYEGSISHLSINIVQSLQCRGWVFALLNAEKLSLTPSKLKAKELVAEPLTIPESLFLPSPKFDLTDSG